MPELPEVETVRRALEPVMEGRRFAAVEQRRADLRFPFPKSFRARLEGTKVLGLRRRAKYLLVDLDRGETLIIHLGMSGRITVLPPAARPKTTARFHNSVPADRRSANEGRDPHDHVIFDLDDTTRIVFNDHRRFGFMDLCKTDGLDGYRFFAHLGPEPLGNRFSPAHLNDALRDKRTPVKAALLDQRVVAGLGNIYVCEALFRAGISPKRLARTIPGKRAERLAPAIRDVLRDAITAGGSSLRDYAHTDGSLGYFQHAFAVYDRAENPCQRGGCKGTVRRIVQSGRSTFYCGHCQR